MKPVFGVNYRPARPAAIGLLVATAILWSLGGLLIKMVSWNPIAIAGMRSAIAAIVMLIYIRKPKLNWSLPQLGGALAYAATVILFVAANKMTTAANAILLQYTAPVYVALFGAWFLKERTRIWDWLSILFVLGGMVLFFLDHLSPGGFTGNLLAIASGFSFACLVLLMRKQKDSSPVESAFLGNLLTAVIGIPFMFSSPAPDMTGWMGLILLGVFQLGMSYILYSLAIKNVTAIEAILIPVVEPLLNPVWVFLIIGEKPGPWAIAGGLIVVISITLRCIITAAKPLNSDY